MPGSGPVYQPTTVSYEQHNGYLRHTHRSRERVRSAKCMQLLLLIFGLFSLLTGFFMVVESAVDISKAYYYGPENTKMSRGATISDYAVIFVGCAAMGMGSIMMFLYLRNEARYRNWNLPCFSFKEHRLTRQLRDHQANNRQILTLNPSTDLLVTAQYAPVPQPQQPALPVAVHMNPHANPHAHANPHSLAHEEEERSKLMGNCLEENERMLEPDPRIVLRPLNKVEDA